MGGGIGLECIGVKVGFGQVDLRLDENGPQKKKNMRQWNNTRTKGGGTDGNRQRENEWEQI